jgi:Tol biopolymer transport system component
MFMKKSLCNMICSYAAVSPDGRKMVAVGDSNQVYLYDISSSGTYTRTSTLTGSVDLSSC